MLENEFSMAPVMEFIKIQSIMGKEGNAGKRYFLFFQQHFQMTSSTGYRDCLTLYSIGTRFNSSTTDCF